MQKFTLQKKTGFCGFGRVEIFRKVDNIFQPFYLFQKNKFYFNLPAGEYQSESNFKEVAKPKNYKFKLPRAERKIIPESFKIHYGVNKNKASINARTGKIFLDEKLFKEISFTERAFILFHELGHCYYVTEWKCDNFSAYMLLKLGFNPSQIALAPNNTLNCQSRTTKTQKKLYNL